MVVIARDYYRSHRWDLARYALQAILDGSDDGSIPPRDKGNPEALLLRALIERDTGQRKQAHRRFRSGARESARSLRGVHQSRRDEARGRKRDRGHQGPREGSALRAERGGRTPRSRRLLSAARTPGRCEEGARQGDEHGFDSRWQLTTTLGSSTFSPPSCRASPVPTISLRRQSRSSRRTSRCAVPKRRQGPGDDVDELLSTAKRKQSELQTQEAGRSAKLSRAAASLGGRPPPPSAGAAPGSSASSRPPRRRPSAAHTAPAAPAGGPSAGGNIVRELPK